MTIALSITVEKKSDGTFDVVSPSLLNGKPTTYNFCSSEAIGEHLGGIIYGVFQVPAVYERFGLGPAFYERFGTENRRKEEKRMTFSEFQRMRKKATVAEMERAGVTHNKRTQYGWLYPGDLLIESTVGWEYEWMGMFCLLVEG